MDIRKKISHDVCTMHFMGTFTFDDHGLFQKEVLTVLDQDTVAHINIDFTELKFINSAGMGLLLLLKDAAQKSSKTLSLSSALGQVEKMFLVSKFDTLFNYSKNNN